MERRVTRRSAQNGSDEVQTEEGNVPSSPSPSKKLKKTSTSPLKEHNQGDVADADTTEVENHAVEAGEGDAKVNSSDDNQTEDADSQTKGAKRKLEDEEHVSPKKARENGDANHDSTESNTVAVTADAVTNEEQNKVADATVTAAAEPETTSEGTSDPVATDIPPQTENVPEQSSEATAAAAVEESTEATAVPQDAPAAAEDQP